MIRCLAVLLVVLALQACQSDPPPPTAEEQAVFDTPVDVELVVPAVRNAMRYDVGRIEAPSGSIVRLVMDNRATTSGAMIHNVVVLRDAGAIDRVGSAAAREADHIPDDPAIVAYTPLAGPGARTAVVFTMPPPGTYPFICTYPGHYTMMQGTLVSTPDPAVPDSVAIADVD